MKEITVANGKKKFPYVCMMKRFLHLGQIT